jgi:hypothetical protein
LNKTDFQVLADLRIAEAQRLMQALALPDGAYYLAGYAVECALKACIAGLTQAGDFPDKQFALECYTHSLEKLVNSAGLKGHLVADVATNPDLKKKPLDHRQGLDRGEPL